MCRRILFVENQFSQFNQIVKILKSVHDKYEIYPKANNSDQEYIRFMDNIRINLDGRYSEQERNNAKDKIEQYIEAKCIEVIIMDYILVGHEEEGNGISLALKLDDVFELPIIFLSGTSRNCKTVEDGLNKLLDNKPWLKIEWIEKGYTGHFLDNKEYIKRYLVTAINRFLGKTTKEMLEEIIDKCELCRNEKEAAIFKINEISSDLPDNDPVQDLCDGLKVKINDNDSIILGNFDDWLRRLNIREYASIRASLLELDKILKNKMESELLKKLTFIKKYKTIYSINQRNNIIKYNSMVVTEEHIAILLDNFKGFLDEDQNRTIYRTFDVRNI